MQRFFATSLTVLALTMCATGAAPVAHAQGIPIPEDAGTTPNLSGTALDPTGSITAAAAEAETKAKIDADKAAGTTKVDPPLPPPSIDGFGPVMQYIMMLFAWLVGVAAITLDNTVYYTIVSMGSYVSHLSAIGVTWRILRDIGNIMLIFGFLAIGITIILNVNWYGSATKMLPMLLIAAVFLNFSLFISEAVIDTGNLFATQFYTQINGGTPIGAKSYNDIAGEGISNKIMGQLGLQTIYTAGRTNTAVFQSGNTWIIGFMGIILFLVVSLVLFALSFILVARFVALIFLIILAPVGFAGLAVPQLANRAKQWWSTLFEQTLTAPILLLMLYIALAVITDATFLTGFCVTTDPANPTCKPDLLGFVGGNFGGFAAMILTFLVAMGLLLAVIIQAKKLSAFGAGLAIKAATAATFGATAYGASALLGGGAFAARSGLQRFARNNAFTRGTSRALRFAEGRTMDLRALPGVSGGLTALGAGELAAPIGRSAVGRVRQGTEAFKKGGEEANRLRDQETRVPLLRTAINQGDDVSMSRLVGRMSDTELESREVADLFAHNPGAAANLPQSRFEKLMQSDKLSDQLKETIRTSRNTGTEARYADTAHPNPLYVNAAGVPRTIADVNLNGAPAGPGGVPPRIPALSSAQRAELPGNILSEVHVMDILTPSDFATIARRGALEPHQQTNMGDYLVHVLRPGDPRFNQITALARTNRSFAAYFGIP